MDLIEKYHLDLTIRHDKEILTKFFNELMIAMINLVEFKFSDRDREKFIDKFLENHYFKKNGQ